MSSSLPMTINLQTRSLSFSQLLRSFMQRHHVSADELASRLRVQRATVRRWLNGEVRRPRQRQDVLRCATYLSLTPPEQEALLMAAGFAASPCLSSPIAAMPTPMPPHLSITLGQMCPSPFVIGPPITEPRQFFGRDYLLHRIFEVWKYLPLQHIAIVGAKRSGKTSLLHYLRRIVDTPPQICVQVSVMIG
jgi:hypothetical protein